ncbi:MAG: nucleotidyltransferase family protein [Actinomycetota bacterium]
MATRAPTLPASIIERLHPMIWPIAAFGVAGSAHSEVSWTAGDDFRKLTSDLRYQKLIGLAVATAESGLLRVDEDQWRELVRMQRDAMLASLAIEGVLLAIDDTFRGAGLEYLVLKGPSIAHSAYEDPSLRPFGDLDLLVRNHDWDQASSLLQSMGFSRAHPEAREGFHASFGKALVHRGSDGMEIDLHRRLVVGPHGLSADPQELFEDVVSFEVGGRRLPRVSNTSLFLHVCMHAVLGTRTPMPLPVRDIFQTAALGVDWELAEDRAKRWNLRAVIPYAVGAAAELLAASPPSGAGSLATRLPSSRRERKWLQAYTSDRRSRGGTAIATVSAIPGVRQKIRYISALLMPSRDFLRSRQASGDEVSYLRRWAVPLRWLVKGRRS